MKAIKAFYLFGALLCVNVIGALAIKRQLDEEKEFEQKLEHLFLDLVFCTYKDVKQRKIVQETIKQYYKPHHKRGGSKYM